MSLLRDTNPELVQELVDSTLADVLTTGSGKSVLWQCEKGHQWTVTVGSRVKGAGCPVCSNRKIVAGINDVATTNPSFVSRFLEADLAKTVHAGSTKKLKFVCDKGHIYTAPVRNVVQFGAGCAVCAGKQVMIGVNDLATTHPGIAKELVNQDLATKLTAGSNKIVEWRCSVDETHVWKASPNSRCGKGRNGCPICANRVVVKGTNDLWTTHPDIAKDLVDADVGYTVTAGSQKKVMWRCSEKHVWEATVASRVLQGSGCPYCSGRMLLVGFNDLATTHPDLASQLVDASLGHKLMGGSHAKVAWKCEHGHTWDAFVFNRTTRDSGCPYCSGHKVLEGETDLATLRPDLAEQLVDSTLGTKLSISSNRKVRWRCKHGHEWLATVSSRTGQDGVGCPYCFGRYAIPGVTDLATTHPLIAKELVDYGLATTLIYGSNKVVKWMCSEGHEYETSVKSHVVGGVGCPICKPHGTGSKEQDLIAVVEQLVGKSSVVTSDRKILGNGQELDIVVPRLRIAVEFNGLWWHSLDAGKGKNYHYDKMKNAQAAGYQLFQIWEDDWDNRRNVVIRALAAKFDVTDQLVKVFPDIDAKCTERLYARNLTFDEVSGAAAKSFLEANHIQGAVSASRHFALLDADDTIRALLSIRSPLNNARMKRKAGEWEIQRYATCGHVIGGFTKLLKHAETTLLNEGVDLACWLSFSDNCISDGSLYLYCGFSVDHIMRPDYKYAGSVTGWKRVPKERFQKKVFRENPDLVWNDVWTESEAALANGLVRIYDAGKVCWTKPVV